MNYRAMMEEALRGVVREALKRVVEDGLPGDHHFFITFATDHPGVGLPDHLRARFPKEMTVVLQHQFWGLEVGDEGFAVTLSFTNVHERLVVPFAAVTAFADPSVQFGLQFRAEEEDGEGAAEPPAESAASTARSEAADEADNVVTLDSFRKK